ncbi:Eukaryotic/viral aspartic protease [Phytophthora megakarya]|uniref:Eukaryotic/viral aspartic protease n=1 Tax=Phytophthora megakarya TaxID=4795 RepID=A0A225VK62_9STRA|nr:Eukaryotic/viral aspartic protease [Phytophthora megakarya]
MDRPSIPAHFETGVRKDTSQRLNNRRQCAEVSTLGVTFAHMVDCLIDTSLTQECVGIRDETYFILGKRGSRDLVYYMDLWVEDLVGQHAILGMNLMVPAGVRIDAADGTACLPDEVRIQLIGEGRSTAQRCIRYD